MNRPFCLHCLKDAQEMKRADELLSPELESLALKCGCRKMNIDMFKLAWSAYDLLNSLGDPAFWTLDKDNEQGTPNFRQVVMETHKNQTAKQQDLQKKWQTGNFKYLESDAVSRFQVNVDLSRLLNIFV